MIPNVREFILNYPINPHQSPDDMKNDLILQLQKMFFYLNTSQKKAFSPDDWVYSYKDETGSKPIDILQQQDAQGYKMTLKYILLLILIMHNRFSVNIMR